MHGIGLLPLKSTAWRLRRRGGITGSAAPGAKDAHTEPCDGGELDWPSWRTFVAAQAIRSSPWLACPNEGGGGGLKEP